MTDLIALAKQAGAHIVQWNEFVKTAKFDEGTLQAFADLIRKDERKAIAALFPQSYQEYFGIDIHDAIRARTTT